MSSNQTVVDELLNALQAARTALWEALTDDELRPFSQVCAEARNHHAIQAADAAIAKAKAMQRADGGAA